VHAEKILSAVEAHAASLLGGSLTGTGLEWL
jgi:hypothetical protein